MKRMSLVIVLMTSLFLAYGSSPNKERLDKKQYCVTFAPTGWLGVSCGWCSIGVSVTGDGRKFCCSDNGYFGVSCGWAIMQNANHEQPFSYGGVNMIPSWAQLHTAEYAEIVCQINDAIANSNYSAEDKDKLYQLPIVFHIDVAQEGTCDEFSNQLFIMPGDYTIDNNGDVTFDIGIAQ